MTSFIIIFHIFIILYGIIPFVHSIISPIIVISFHNIVCIIHDTFHIIIVIFFFFIDGLIFLVVSSVVFPICDRAPSSASWYAASSFVLISSTSSCDFVFWYFVIYSRLVVLIFTHKESSV